MGPIPAWGQGGCAHKLKSCSELKFFYAVVLKTFLWLCIICLFVCWPGKSWEEILAGTIVAGIVFEEQGVQRVFG